MSTDSSDISNNWAGFLTKNVFVCSPWTDVVGANRVGKTCLIQRIVADKYDESKRKVHFPEIKKDFYPGSIRFRDDPDAQVKENGGSPISRYTDIVLCCYDVTDSSSFDYMADHFNEIKQTVNGSKYVRFVVVATKCDLCVEKDTIGQEFAQQKGVEYIETSAKTGMGCEALIDILLPYRKKYLKN